MKEIGRKGQEVLKNSSVIIIGAGGLGSNLANILVRSGIGKVVIVDDDTVDITNLHRQTVFDENDIGKYKSKVLEEKLRNVNNEVEIDGIVKKIDASNIESLVKKFDIILDGTDDMKTRFIINEAAVKNNIPWIYTGVHSTYCIVKGIIPGKTACLRCFIDKIPPNLDPERDGILSNLPSIAASIEATETLRILLGKKPSGLIIYDIWRQDFEVIELERNKNCTCCVKHDFEYIQR